MDGTDKDTLEKIQKKLRIDVSKDFVTNEKLPDRFDGFTPGEEIEIDRFWLEGKGTTQKVPTFNGYTINGKQETVYKTKFVLPVYDLKLPFLANVMVPLPDLVIRTVKPTFEVDQELYRLGKMPIRLWTPEGTPLNNPRVFNSVLHLDPLTGSKEARDLGSVGDKWKVKVPGSRRTRPRKMSWKGRDTNQPLKVEPHLATVQKEQLSIETVSASNPEEYQNFINGTLEQCRASSGTRFNVKSRFFDEAVKGIVFNMLITHEYGPSSGTTAKTEIKNAWKKALQKSEFQPNLGEIWFQPFEVDEKDFDVVGSHPGGLYEIWMPRDTTTTFRKKVCKDPYCFPDEMQAKEANEALNLENLRADESGPNRSTVTSSGIRSAGATTRYPQQTAVMNNVSPNQLVQDWWEMGPGDKGAEWLHRCAFSYGGIHVNQLQGLPNSAQVPDNLVIGSVETNTAMLRTEGFIKRVVQYNGYVDIQVDTVIAYPDVPQLSWMKEASYLWLAPMLTYTYTLCANQKSGINPLQMEYTFLPFMRDQVTRFEYELDLAMEELCLGWKIK